MLTLIANRTITLTRKLFTMLLSVIVYNHKLTLGQWLGAAVVFAGISVEAFVKRKGSSQGTYTVETPASLILQMSTRNLLSKKKRGRRSSLYNR